MWHEYGAFRIRASITRVFAIWTMTFLGGIVGPVTVCITAPPTASGISRCGRYRREVATEISVYVLLFAWRMLSEFFAS